MVVELLEKRVRDSEAAGFAPDPSFKKLKHEATGAMDSKEIASAVTLASLASFSPSTKTMKIRQLDKTQTLPATAVSTTVSLGDTRSPRSEPIPISPDPRSPIRSIKRVHFASNVKPKPPPETPGHQFEFQQPAAVSPHSFPMRVHHPHAFGMFPAMAMHQPPHWMSPRMPPQRMMHHPFGPPSNTHWICDFCNAAAFNTFEEACMHEETCKVQCRQNTPARAMTFGSMSGAGNSRIEGEAGISTMGKAAPASECFSGSISLAIPESDSEWLSEANCFVRKYCVEAFSANEEDVLSTSKRGRITLHQVGIRCRYCKHLPLKERAVAAVSYPTSVAGIYESVKRWVRVHKDNCAIPEEVTSKMADLHNQNEWIPTTRQYWTDSARALGMVDTEEGIRFSCDPKCIRPESNTNDGVQQETSPVAVARKANDGQALADGDFIVYQDGMRIVPAYVYFLMRQVESCHFSEVDRFVARSKGPVGYPGFQCRHCSGHAGLGKYFPVSAKTLSTNSTSQNIHAHLLKCRKCPDHIKEQLVTLKAEKSRSPRLEPGWRKVFFDKIWNRLHG